ncbi:hypothetical protein ElyMa_003896200, partial [Elysia marginata]
EVLSAPTNSSIKSGESKSSGDPRTSSIKSGERISGSGWRQFVPTVDLGGIENELVTSG